MVYDTSWSVEKYFSPTEPQHHWELRRKFMEENKGRFTEERVVCLGQTFTNIEILGCRYPTSVMELIEELSHGITQPFRDEQKNRIQRTFVSGSDAAEAKVSKATKRKFTTDNNQRKPCQTASACKYGNFVPASFKLSPDNHYTDLSSTDLGKEVIKETSDERENNALLPHQLSKFILVRLEYVEEDKPSNILQRSAGFCKMPITWNFNVVVSLTGNDEEEDSETVECLVKLNATNISLASGSTKKDAKDVASAGALIKLEKQCYTIMVKNRYTSGDGTTVNANTLEFTDENGHTVQGTENSSDCIEQSNVGHKLLKMMGWSGGGLGKGGQGISEPIRAADFNKRQGFGSSQSDSQFKSRIRKLLEEYTSSHNPYDLVFTPDFNSDQRATIHNFARRLSLKSKSHGKGDDRFITISRKFDGEQIIQELLSKGGSNEKYVVIPPSNSLT